MLRLTSASSRSYKTFGKECSFDAGNNQYKRRKSIIIKSKGRDE
jgi:hypothetical protein